MSHIWMQHSEHGGKAELPAEAAEMWALKGWVPCEAPTEADPAMVEHQPRFLPTAGQLHEEHAALIEKAQAPTDEPSTETEEH